MRFLARILSFVALVGAVAMATVDAIRFVATGAVDLSSLQTVLAWAGVVPVESIALNDAGKDLAAKLFENPAFAVLLVLSLGFWVIGYRRPVPLRPFDT